MARESSVRLAELEYAREVAIRELGSVDPNVLALMYTDQAIDDYISRLRWAETDDPRAAYELIASWSALWRIDPAYLAGATGHSIPRVLRPGRDRWCDLLRPTLQRIGQQEHAMLNRFDELLRLGMQSAKPLAWVESLERASADGLLDDAGDDGPAVPRLATSLMQELDRLELFFWAAERRMHTAGVVVRMADQLAHARHKLRQNALRLRAAREWLVAVLTAANLTADPSLLTSLDNMRLVLLAQSAREAQTAVAGSHVLELFRELVRSLLVSRPVARPVLAAATAPERPVVDTTTLRWHSPEKEYIAHIDQPIHPSDWTTGRTLVISVARLIQAGGLMVPGPPATELAGLRVRLCGVAAELDHNARARFSPESLACLLDTDAVPVTFEIEVESQWTGWPLVNTA